MSRKLALVVTAVVAASLNASCTSKQSRSAATTPPAIASSSSATGSASTENPARPVSSGNVLTPADAKKVVEAYGDNNNKSNAAHDSAMQAEYQRDSARAISTANYNIARRVGLPAYDPFTFDATRVFVPRQTTYPAVFVAATHFKVAGKPASKKTLLYLFRSDSADDAWRVSSWAYVPEGAEPPKFDVDSDGYIQQLDPTSMSITTEKLTEVWLAALSASYSARPLSTAWTPTAALKEMPYPPKKHIRLDHTFSRGSYDLVCVATSGGALCFVSATWSRRLSVDGGYALSVTSPEAQASNGGIAAGKYSNISVTLLHNAAIEVARISGRGSLRLHAYDAQPISGIAR